MHGVECDLPAAGPAPAPAPLKTPVSAALAPGDTGLRLSQSSGRSIPAPDPVEGCHPVLVAPVRLANLKHLPKEYRAAFGCAPGSFSSALRSATPSVLANPGLAATAHARPAGGPDRAAASGGPLPLAQDPAFSPAPPGGPGGPSPGCPSAFNGRMYTQVPGVWAAGTPGPTAAGAAAAGLQPGSCVLLLQAGHSRLAIHTLGESPMWRLSRERRHTTCQCPDSSRAPIRTRSQTLPGAGASAGTEAGCPACDDRLLHCTALLPIYFENIYAVTVSGTLPAAGPSAGGGGGGSSGGGGGGPAGSASSSALLSFARRRGSAEVAASASEPFLPGAAGAPGADARVLDIHVLVSRHQCYDQAPDTFSHLAPGKDVSRRFSFVFSTAAECALWQTAIQAAMRRAPMATRSRMCIAGPPLAPGLPFAPPPGPKPRVAATPATLFNGAALLPESLAPRPFVAHLVAAADAPALAGPLADAGRPQDTAFALDEGLLREQAIDPLFAQDLCDIFNRRYRPPPPRRVLCLINPFGGRRKAVQIFRAEVEPMLRLAGLDVTTICHHEPFDLMAVSTLENAGPAGDRQWVTRFSHLTYTYGLVAEIDLLSDQFRVLGPARFHAVAIMRAFVPPSRHYHLAYLPKAEPSTGAAGAAAQASPSSPDRAHLRGTAPPSRSSSTAALAPGSPGGPQHTPGPDPGAESPTDAGAASEPGAAARRPAGPPAMDMAPAADGSASTVNLPPSEADPGGAGSDPEHPGAGADDGGAARAGAAGVDHGPAAGRGSATSSAMAATPLALPLVPGSLLPADGPLECLGHLRSRGWRVLLDGQTPARQPDGRPSSFGILACNVPWISLTDCVAPFASSQDGIIDLLVVHSHNQPPGAGDPGHSPVGPAPTASQLEASFGDRVNLLQSFESGTAYLSPMVEYVHAQALVLLPCEGETERGALAAIDGEGCVCRGVTPRVGPGGGRRAAGGRARVRHSRED
ncbi:hypothetical protein H696_00012 [Fonticula alba]|uniref:DAGKc domain-containing protein n=1 Tax=Fonticula alba TaxID=691883 RepID=A0A058ZG32_FONAL|nr:hypothetical protein H696_00012 [Fonticula alba]KCV72427.1 hypothetical protein H696_00012 [Fonticula alba]|eukprot:XP_009492128.1 hypothetical protein H696_00012 [Fonticula alba]